MKNLYLTVICYRQFFVHDELSFHYFALCTAVIDHVRNDTHHVR